MSSSRKPLSSLNPKSSPTAPRFRDEDRLIVENAPEILALISEAGEILRANSHVEKVLGFRKEAIHGRNIFDFIHPDDRARAAQEYAETIVHEGERYPTVLRLIDARGMAVPVEIIANTQLRNPGIRAVIFTARDLRFRQDVELAIAGINEDANRRVEDRTTELARMNASLRIENQARRQAELELQHTVSVLNTTLDSTADGILVISKSGKVTSCNQKFAELWNLGCDSPIGKYDSDLLKSVMDQLQTPDEFLDRVNTLYANPELTSFDEIRLRDGRIFERYSQPQRLGSEIIGRVWSFRDVTRSRQLELELRQSQKMEALGRLAGGIAHDFNNLLMLISGYATQLIGKSDAESCGTCEQILATTRRAASVTRQLLAFSRKTPDAPTVNDLNQIVLDMELMLQRLLSDDIQLTISVGTEPQTVYVDVSQVEMMIMNLAINAQDAMAQGGLLRISTKEAPRTGARCASRACALLEVSDTGHGMSPDVKAHIFEPFFTTKQLGKGTGLGLSTVFGIVKRAGGEIEVESEQGRGTTFRIYLPKVDTAPAPASIVRELSPPARGKETILVAEDESGIRAMTKAYLETLGYRVLEAADGLEAVHVSKTYAGNIDLVLTDVLMPQMRGDASVNEIRKQRPKIKAIFVSGYTDVELTRELDHVLYKPFDFPELGRRIRSALNGE